MIAQGHQPDFVFRRSGRVHLNRQGRQFRLLLAAEVCGSAVVMLNTPCSEVVWRVLATHSIRQFSLYFPSRASPCTITFELDSTSILCNLKVPYRPLVPNPSHINPVYTLSTQVFLRSISILSSHLCLVFQVVSFRFRYQKRVRTYLLPHTCHIPCPSHSNWFDHPDNV